MKETGIIMSGNHSRLILEGLKTMTRRVIKPQPEHELTMYHLNGAINWRDTELNLDEYPYGNYTGCPYGQVGDRLWVRETTWISDCGTYRCYINQASGDVISSQVRYTDRGINRIYRFSVLSRPDPDKKGYAFKRWFGEVDEGENIVSRIEAEFHKKQSARFMPRWASRITLEITGVRAERLQEISFEDVIAEGLNPFRDCAGTQRPTTEARWLFAELWDSLNAKRGYPWEANNWVWVISFKVV